MDNTQPVNIIESQQEEVSRQYYTVKDVSFEETNSERGGLLKQLADLKKENSNLLRNYQKLSEKQQLLINQKDQIQRLYEKLVAEKKTLEINLGTLKKECRTIKEEKQQLQTKNADLIAKAKQSATQTLNAKQREKNLITKRDDAIKKYDGLKKQYDELNISTKKLYIKEEQPNKKQSASNLNRQPESISSSSIGRTFEQRQANQAQVVGREGHSQRCKGICIWINHNAINFLLGLIGEIVSIALGWKTPEQKGFGGFVVAFVLIGIHFIYSFTLVIMSCQKKFGCCNCCQEEENNVNQRIRRPQTG